MVLYGCSSIKYSTKIFAIVDVFIQKLFVHLLQPMAADLLMKVYLFRQALPGARIQYLCINGNSAGNQIQLLLVQSLNTCSMTDMIVFEFNFQGISYKAIATPWKNGGNGCFRITVMNGEIENLLFGHNVLSLSENRFLNNENVNNPELAELQRCILQQFPKHLTPVEKLAS